MEKKENLSIFFLFIHFKLLASPSSASSPRTTYSIFECYKFIIIQRKNWVRSTEYVSIEISIFVEIESRANIKTSMKNIFIYKFLVVNIVCVEFQISRAHIISSTAYSSSYNSGKVMD